jgi:multiple sugar transport system permease protein
VHALRLTEEKLTLTIAKTLKEWSLFRGAVTAGTFFAVLMVAPLALWVVITIAVPLAYSFYISFTDLGVIGTEANFVGLDNYAKVVAEPEFRSALGRSLIWTFGGAILQVVLAFATALVLNQAFRGRSFARTWILLPWIIPTIVIAVIWRWLLNSNYGVINFLITTLGISEDSIDFLGSTTWALPTVIAINAWRWFPFLALIILAGLQGIPEELYEAAKVDGANALQRFFNITLPLLQPVLFVLGLIGTLLAFNVFDVIWLLTQGGPSNSTQTLPVLVYERAFDSFAMGEASAISVLLCLFLLLFAVLFITLVPAGDTENEVI